MIDFDYTAPELIPFRIQQVRESPDEPLRIGGVEYAPIVRCRDCKHKFMDTPGHPYCGRLGEYSEFSTDDEMFCAWAERRQQ